MKSLAEVCRELASLGSRLRAADDGIARTYRLVERFLEARKIRRIVRAPIAPGVDLAWSSRNRRPWRLVIRDEDGAIDVLRAEPIERVEAMPALAAIVSEVTR